MNFKRDVDEAFDAARSARFTRVASAGMYTALGRSYRLAE